MIRLDRFSSWSTTTSRRIRRWLAWPAVPARPWSPWHSTESGFPFVYGVSSPPKHDDFLIEWQDDMAYLRDGHNLRCVFVASRAALQNDQLIGLIG